ncbi:LysR family transcriptional regulator [Saccharospirillum salsuginis]|uniref:LysR family transcriptional regulator n=1 Tax=Saccharospirillum salsuginis TaxID=418750 RepID=A0A918N5A6_9GAMM|nr:LysR family transcriptional regulator [Saccharospirillum salsuginis]GGX38724.1 LysR family transcriptional regulator [Saccharospirillum salsuginis]
MSQPADMPGTLPLLDTDVLRTFVAIAESGSFTRAAQQVFRTPSALSMQIKRLEETLGQPLFVREARQVRLTPEGETLLSFGRRLLKLNEEAVSQFLAPSLEGKVRFGTPDDVGTRILPGLLAQFARSHPSVQVDVVVDRSADLIDQLDKDELDLTLVTAGNQGQDPSRGEVVHTEPLVWVGREGGIAAQRSPLPVSLAAHGCCWRSMSLDALDKAGIDYRIAYTSIHCAGQEAAMVADLAISAFPQSLVKPPLTQLGTQSGLPPLGDYQILLLRRDGLGSASETLASYVKDMFDRFKT